MDRKFRYAAIEEDDMINGEGICVSFWTQGCPHRCPGCHNPETWSFNGGIEKTETELLEKIDKAMTKNGLQRNFSILGGEPLCKENFHLTLSLILHIKKRYPKSKIFLWTGYDYLKSFRYSVLSRYVDVIIDGPFIESQKNTTLKFRGSSNQRVLKRGIDF